MEISTIRRFWEEYVFKNSKKTTPQNDTTTAAQRPHMSYKKLGPKAYLLYEPSNGDIECDIVFVHGLYSNEIFAWINSNDVVWPAVFLPKDFPKARVISVGYKTSIVLAASSPSTASMTTPLIESVCTDDNINLSAPLSSSHSLSTPSILSSPEISWIESTTETVTSAAQSVMRLVPSVVADGASSGNNCNGAQQTPHLLSGHDFVLPEVEEGNEASADLNSSALLSSSSMHVVPLSIAEERNKKKEEKEKKGDISTNIDKLDTQLCSSRSSFDETTGDVRQQERQLYELSSVSSSALIIEEEDGVALNEKNKGNSEGSRQERLFTDGSVFTVTTAVLGGGLGGEKHLTSHNNYLRKGQRMDLSINVSSIDNISGGDSAAIQRGRGQESLGKKTGPLDVVAVTVDDCSRIVYDSLTLSSVNTGNCRSSNPGKCRPVIFVTHSLGGLAIKQLILNLYLGALDGPGGVRREFNQNLLRNINGIITFGTPHFGSEVASFLAAIDGAALFNVIGSYFVGESHYQDGRAAELPINENILSNMEEVPTVLDGSAAMASLSVRTATSATERDDSFPAVVEQAAAATNGTTTKETKRKRVKKTIFAGPTSIVRFLGLSNIGELSRINLHFLRVASELRIPVLAFNEGRKISNLFRVVEYSSSDTLSPFRGADGTVDIKLLPSGVDPNLFPKPVVLEGDDHRTMKCPSSRNTTSYRCIREFIKKRWPKPALPSTLEEPMSYILNEDAKDFCTTTALKLFSSSPGLEKDIEGSKDFPVEDGPIVIECKQIWDETLDIVSIPGVKHHLTVFPDSLQSLLNSGDILVSMLSHVFDRSGPLLFIRFWLIKIKETLQFLYFNERKNNGSYFNNNVNASRDYNNQDKQHINNNKNAFHKVNDGVTKIRNVSRGLIPAEVVHLAFLNERLSRFIKILSEIAYTEQPIRLDLLFGAVTTLHSDVFDELEIPACLRPQEVLNCLEWRDVLDKDSTRSEVQNAATEPSLTGFAEAAWGLKGVSSSLAQLLAHIFFSLENDKLSNASVVGDSFDDGDAHRMGEEGLLERESPMMTLVRQYLEGMDWIDSFPGHKTFTVVQLQEARRKRETRRREDVSTGDGGGSSSWWASVSFPKSLYGFDIMGWNSKPHHNRETGARGKHGENDLIKIDKNNNTHNQSTLSIAEQQYLQEWHANVRLLSAAVFGFLSSVGLHALVGNLSGANLMACQLERSFLERVSSLSFDAICLRDDVDNSVLPPSTKALVVFFKQQFQVRNAWMTGGKQAGFIFPLLNKRVIFPKEGNLKEAVVEGRARANNINENNALDEKMNGSGKISHDYQNSDNNTDNHNNIEMINSGKGGKIDNVILQENNENKFKTTKGTSQNDPITVSASSSTTFDDICEVDTSKCKSLPGQQDTNNKENNKNGSLAVPYNSSDNGAAEDFIRLHPAFRSLWCDVHVLAFCEDIRKCISLYNGEYKHPSFLLPKSQLQLFRVKFSLSLVHDKDMGDYDASKQGGELKIKEVPNELNSGSLLSWVSYLSATRKKEEKNVSINSKYNFGLELERTVYNPQAPFGEAEDFANDGSSDEKDTQFIVDNKTIKSNEKNVIGKAVPSSSTANQQPASLPGSDWRRLQVPVHEQVYRYAYAINAAVDMLAVPDWNSAVMAPPFMMQRSKRQGNIISTIHNSGGVNDRKGYWKEVPFLVSQQGYHISTYHNSAAHHHSSYKSMHDRVVIDPAALDPCDPQLGLVRAKWDMFELGSYDNAIATFQEYLCVHATRSDIAAWKTNLFAPHPALSMDVRVWLGWAYLMSSVKHTSIKELVEILKIAQKSDGEAQEGNLVTPPPLTFTTKRPRLYFGRSNHQELTISSSDIFAVAATGPLQEMQLFFADICATPQGRESIAQFVRTIEGKIEKARMTGLYERRLQTAIDIFESLIVENKEPWAFCGKGRAEALKGDRSKATENFTHAVELSDAACRWACSYMGEINAPFLNDFYDKIRPSSRFLVEDDGQVIGGKVGFLQRLKGRHNKQQATIDQMKWYALAGGNSRALTSAAYRIQKPPATRRTLMFQTALKYERSNLWALSLLSRCNAGIPRKALASQAFTALQKMVL